MPINSWKQVEHAIAMRRVVWVLVQLGGLFAAISLFYRALASGASTRPEGLGMLWLLVVTAVVYLFYATYLRAVAQREVFDKRVEAQVPWGVAMTLLVLLAYALSVVAIAYHGLKPAVYLSLAAAYFVSVYGHARELAHERHKVERFFTSIWLAIDLGSAAFLSIAGGLSLAGNKSLLEPIAWGTTIKDWIIVGSAVMWQAARYVPAYFEGEYNAKNYKDLISLSRPEGINESSKGVLGRVRNQLPAASELRVLDFGSATSERSIDLVTRIVGLEAARLRWTAFDLDPLYQDDARARPLTLPVEFVASPQQAAAVAKHADLLVVTHSLYSVGQLRGVIELARVLKPGAVVLVRGYAPNSVFAAPFADHGSASWVPGVAHLWNTVFLTQLREECGLQACAARAQCDARPWSADAFVGFIGHGYALEPPALRGFQRILATMYGARTGRVFVDVTNELRALNEASGAAELLHSPDLLYAFVKR